MPKALAWHAVLENAHSCGLQNELKARREFPPRAMMNSVMERLIRTQLNGVRSWKMKCKYMVDQIKDFKILTHSLSDWHFGFLSCYHSQFNPKVIPINGHDALHKSHNYHVTWYVGVAFITFFALQKRKIVVRFARSPNNPVTAAQTPISVYRELGGCSILKTMKYINFHVLV